MQQYWDRYQFSCWTTWYRVHCKGTRSLTRTYWHIADFYLSWWVKFGNTFWMQSKNKSYSILHMSNRFHQSYKGLRRARCWLNTNLNVCKGSLWFWMKVSSFIMKPVVRTWSWFYLFKMLGSTWKWSKC